MTTVDIPATEALVKERPAKCQVCQQKKAKACIQRKGTDLWLCKHCITDAKFQFEQFGTVRQLRSKAEKNQANSFEEAEHQAAPSQERPQASSTNQKPRPKFQKTVSSLSSADYVRMMHNPTTAMDFAMIEKALANGMLETSDSSSGEYETDEEEEDAGENATIAVSPPAEDDGLLGANEEDSAEESAEQTKGNAAAAPQTEIIDDDPPPPVEIVDSDDEPPPPPIEEE